MTTAKYRYQLSLTDTCPKCDEEGEAPRLVYSKGPPEVIRIFCNTCGYEATPQPTADTKVGP